MAKEVAYVTYTCKNPKCRKAFLDIDPYNDINDVPLKNRYCPDCVALGFKNQKAKKEDVRKATFETFMDENNITEPKDRKFIMKYCNKEIDRLSQMGKRVVLLSVFKNAHEVLGYQDWKQQ